LVEGDFAEDLVAVFLLQLLNLFLFFGQRGGEGFFEGLEEVVSPEPLRR
jgi:hypothetical protein